jgi:hypothetical protein
MSKKKEAKTMTFFYAHFAWYAGFTARVFMMCLILMGITAFAYGSQYPQQWPWKGFVMASTTSDASDVAKIIETVDANFLALQLKPRLRAIMDKIDPEQALAREFTWADKVLDECTKHRITAMIVMYQFPMDPSLGIKQDMPVFWNKNEHLDEVVATARRVATYFAGRGIELVGYQFLSEPLVRAGGKVKIPDQWQSLLERIINTLRAEDPDCWVAVSPGPGGEALGYRFFDKLDHERIIYNFHMYKPHAFTHQGVGDFKLGPAYPGFIQYQYWDKARLERTVGPVVRFQSKHDVPIFVGEFSAARWAKGAEQYLLDAVSIFNANKWGWVYHSYSGSHVWNPHYDNEYCATKRTEFEKHFVGVDTVRWNTLRKAFAFPAQKKP